MTSYVAYANRKATCAGNAPLAICHRMKSDEHLPEVLTRKQTDEGFWSVLDAIDNGFLPSHLSGGDPGGHIGVKL